MLWRHPPPFTGSHPSLPRLLPSFYDMVNTYDYIYASYTEIWRVKGPTAAKEVLTSSGLNTGGIDVSPIRVCDPNDVTNCDNNGSKFAHGLTLSASGRLYVAGTGQGVSDVANAATAAAPIDTGAVLLGSGLWWASGLLCRSALTFVYGQHGLFRLVRTGIPGCRSDAHCCIPPPMPPACPLHSWLPQTGRTNQREAWATTPPVHSPPSAAAVFSRPRTALCTSCAPERKAATSLMSFDRPQRPRRAPPSTAAWHP